MLTKRTVRAYFNYDLAGYLVRLKSSGGQLLGKINGYKNDNGYLQIRIKNHLYFIHRVIWIGFYGCIPKGKQIDHINGNRTDNRIENLRCVTRTENNQNQHRAHRDNKTGYLGVTWLPINKKYRAQIQTDKKYQHLGLFVSAEEAYEAYINAKRQLHNTNTL